MTFRGASFRNAVFFLYLKVIGNMTPLPYSDGHPGDIKAMVIVLQVSFWACVLDGICLLEMGSKITSEVMVFKSYPCASQGCDIYLETSLLPSCSCPFIKSSTPSPDSF